MALTAKIFKANIQIADMDRHYYNDHLLTIAQHPSETDERMMVRLLAFALNADERLTFAEGITDTNQADVWIKDYNEQVTLWIMVGLPDEKLIRKAVSKAEQVIIYSYGGRVADMWFNKLKLADYKNLKVFNLTSQDTQALAALANRGMKLNFTIQDGEILLANETSNFNVTPQVLK